MAMLSLVMLIMHMQSCCRAAICSAARLVEHAFHMYRNLEPSAYFTYCATYMKHAKSSNTL